MLHALLLAAALGSPQSDADAAIALAKAQSAKPKIEAPKTVEVKQDGFYIVWPEGTWSWPPATRDANGTVEIRGPWHDGKQNVPYATLQDASRVEIETAVAAARRTWAAEKAVSQKASPFNQGATTRDTTVRPADGSNSASPVMPATGSTITNAPATGRFGGIKGGGSQSAIPFAWPLPSAIADGDLDGLAVAGQKIPDFVQKAMRDGGLQLTQYVGAGGPNRSVARTRYKDSTQPPALVLPAEVCNWIRATDPPLIAVQVGAYPTGPWPADLDFPAGLSRYKRAAYTQAIAVTGPAEHLHIQYDEIKPIHRLLLENADWHQSGGMRGIAGFRSDLYRNDAAAKQVTARIGNIRVKNSQDYFQNNRGWIAEYPNGSLFLDVLSNEKSGGVFEIRQRLKKEGKWQSDVLFSDERERPVGYTGLTKNCASCHSLTKGPGTGGYATGLVPGSDTVFSVGFTDLESRGK